MVRPSELAVGGGACLAAALAVPVTAPADAVRGVVVDGRAGPAASALAERWEVAVALWSADLVAHGEALVAAAAAYAAGDDDAAATLGQR